MLFVPVLAIPQFAPVLFYLELLSARLDVSILLHPTTPVINSYHTVSSEAAAQINAGGLSQWWIVGTLVVYYATFAFELIPSETCSLVSGTHVSSSTPNEKPRSPSMPMRISQYTAKKAPTVRRYS